MGWGLEVTQQLITDYEKLLQRREPNSPKSSQQREREKAWLSEKRQ